MKLSDLLFLKVVTEQEKFLGHVIDLRCQPNPEARSKREASVRELLYGVGGLLERLGLREVTTETIPWESVVRIERGTIVVRAAKR
jgi:sporulation protein YlmC with PRC-barrel domain